MSKFGNRKTFCLSRHEHDSKFEADYCNRLLAMKQAGEIKAFNIQVPFEMYVNNALICVHCVHCVDFVVTPKGWSPLNGQDGLEAHEAKGFRTDVWSIKHKLFKALYPGIKYVIVQKGERKRSCKATRKINLIIKRSQSKKS